MTPAQRMPLSSMWGRALPEVMMVFLKKSTPHDRVSCKTQAGFLRQSQKSGLPHVCLAALYMQWFSCGSGEGVVIVPLYGGFYDPS